MKILPPEVNSFFLRLVVREHCEKMLAGGSDSPCLLGFMLELLQLVSFCANDAMKYLVRSVFKSFSTSGSGGVVIYTVHY